jgi:hypothetical protein
MNLQKIKTELQADLPVECRLLASIALDLAYKQGKIDLMKEELKETGQLRVAD